MKQIPPTQIQCVELFVAEVFSEFLSELFLIFPSFDVCMLLPSFQPTMIGNNHPETVVAMCFAVHFLDVFEAAYLQTLSNEFKSAGGVCKERLKIR